MRSRILVLGSKEAEETEEEAEEEEKEEAEEAEQNLEIAFRLLIDTQGADGVAWKVV